MDGKGDRVPVSSLTQIVNAIYNNYINSIEFKSELQAITQSLKPVLLINSLHVFEYSRLCMFFSYSVIL